MRHMLTKALKRGPLYHAFRNVLQKRRQVRDLQEWEQKGRPYPPPHLVKQRVLRTYAQEYQLKVLVETGTYLGDMVEAMKGSFEKIYSIELSDGLFRLAQQRFAGVRHVEITHGDSGIELVKVVKTIEQPALFWLDGHYSGGIAACGDKASPIYEELRHILEARDYGHVIIIDDARCFGAMPGYPTIDDLERYILSHRDNLDIVVRDDIIRVTPRR